MAGIAAGALVAEQVLATGIEAVAAVAVARPTPPPKALLTQISWALLDEDKCVHPFLPCGPAEALSPTLFPTLA